MSPLPSSSPATPRPHRSAPRRAALGVACLFGLVGFLGIGALGAGAAPASTPAAPPPAPAAAPAGRIVVTGHPLAAILREVVGTRLDVVNLLPGGASPHTYEPRPSDLVNTERALALLHASPLLDAWAARLPTARRIEYMRLVPKAERLPTLEIVGPGAHDHAHDHGHGEPGHVHPEGDDPHFWTDPLVVRASLPALVEALVKADPAGAATYRTNATRFATDLGALHDEVGALLAPVRGRPVVLFHPSFQYLLRRHGLPIVAVVEPAPGKEPTPRYLREIVGTIRKAGAKVVFGEPQLPRRAIAVVAETAGVALAELDPIGGVPGRTSYRELVLFNARALAGALK